MAVSEDAPELRAEVREVLELWAGTRDAARPEAVAKRRRTGHWTAREQLDAFLDPDSFVEYGAMARPARADMDGPADGLVMGTGRQQGRPVAVMAYDYTVYAGTQSLVNHKKHDRMFELVEQLRLPFVLWLEGGGARPHDLTVGAGMGLDLPTFMAFARLSGLVPLVGIVTGRCFAGNANLAGMCDVIIATPKANIGMAGPPLVSAALGEAVTAEDIGPLQVQEPNGVVDLTAADEAEAIALATRYLGYFAGPATDWQAPEATVLRDLLPENPRRAYNVKRVIEGIADIGSVLELRPKFGRAIVTSLIRVEGRALGVIANQPMVLAGAIDSPASDKASRFIQLCDAFDVPMLFLCDTPGLMVGPEVEKTALVRHSGRILINLAAAQTPFMTVILRKAYGLGGYVMGMRGLDPVFCVGWPTAEFGGMGLEGAVNITHREQLAAAADEAERARVHAAATEELRQRNTALAVAGKFEIDDVIDPAETRRYIAATLRALPPAPARSGRRRAIDAW